MERGTALLYDEDCGLCRTILGAILALDRAGRIRPVPIGSDEARALTPDMTDEQREASFHIVYPDGTIRSAGAGLAELLPALKLAPGISERGYRAVAENRSRLGRFVPGALKARADARIAERRNRN